MKVKYFLLYAIISLLLSSCGDDDKNFVIADGDLPPVDVQVKRYGKALFELDTSDIQSGLKRIKPDFKYFLDTDLNDENNIRQIYDFVTDTVLRSIFRKSVEVYPDNKYLDGQFTGAFRYFKYYFPKEGLPQVYTFISGMQYENPIWIQDTVMVIALDVYLGSDYVPYSGLGLPHYKIRCMRPENLTVDVMKYFYHSRLNASVRQNTLLDRMVGAGKMLYFLDRVLPETADSLKICYTQKQLDWAAKNEKNIWAFMIQNELLYTTDYKSQTKLIQDGPFTTGFSRQSPARLGVWMGWQIVSDFMKNNPEVTLNELIKITDSQKLLNDSGYKP
jgi:hypothetical protein